MHYETYGLLKSWIVLYLLDRNTSGLVTADFILTFSQKFHMRHLNQFYSTLYESRRLGLMPIDVINDTSKYPLQEKHT